MKKILVTGASGLLGRYLALTQPKDYEVLYAGYHSRECNIQIDITNKLSVYRLFSDYKPDVIIHAASLGNVDFCEKIPHIADLVNVEGTENLVDTLNSLKYKTKFVYVSTNAVYDGNNPTYSEESEQHPINKYGFTKRNAEFHVMNFCDDWLIVRPFMLYGYPYVTGRENWLTILIDRLGNDLETNLINDIIWQPTSARFCAKTIWTLLDKTNESFNVSQGNSMSLFDFGEMVQSVFSPNKDLIKPISHTKFQTVAKRPIDTSYDITKISKLVDIPYITDELESYYKEYNLINKDIM